MEFLNSTVGIYDSHKKAIVAVRKLQEEGFSVDNISLVGSAKIKDDHLHVTETETVLETTTAIGSVFGTILGTLAGLSLVAVPGLGVLYAAGAMIGAAGGFSIGTASGGLAGVLLSLGIGKDGILLYNEHLKEGKVMVVLHGTKEEVHNAHLILDQTEHHELNKH